MSGELGRQSAHPELTAPSPELKELPKHVNGSTYVIDPGRTAKTRNSHAVRGMLHSLACGLSTHTAGLWTGDASALAMEVVSPAIATIYGVKNGALPGANLPIRPDLVERFRSSIISGFCV